MSRSLFTTPNPGQPHLVALVGRTAGTIEQLTGATLASNNAGIAVQAEGGRVRFTFDGSDPVGGSDTTAATKGFAIDPGDMSELSLAEAQAARWVAEGFQATLQIGGYSS